MLWGGEEGRSVNSPGLSYVSGIPPPHAKNGFGAGFRKVEPASSLATFIHLRELALRIRVPLRIQIIESYTEVRPGQETN